MAGSIERRVCISYPCIKVLAEGFPTYYRTHGPTGLSARRQRLIAEVRRSARRTGFFAASVSAALLGQGNALAPSLAKGDSILTEPHRLP